VISAGKEPMSSSEPQLPIIFDWTVMTSVAEAIQKGAATARTELGALVKSLATHKTHSHIPSGRRAIWTELQNAEAVHLEFMEPGWTSGALRRERQAQIGDVLIAISGGEGVEHLAREYINRGKPVIPLDLRLGSSTDDGTGGAVRLAGQALAQPAGFFRVGSGHSAQNLLDMASTRAGASTTGDVVTAVMRLIDALAAPKAFYVRLLDDAVAEYPTVEEFFRSVVDPVVVDLGYEPFQMGRGKNEHAWIDQAIFEELHYSGIAVVDLTGLRQNCFMELGYALGNTQRVMITVMQGTRVPFDPAAIERHQWNVVGSNSDRQKAFKDYWLRNVDRPPLVKPRR
jgi:hypothetical protein